ncbi:MAG: carboxymuconolactone decarboxylase family protein [Planctomycetota bacterium]
MTDFQVHDLTTAPAESRPYLEGAKQAFGRIPNLLAVMADAPAALASYMSLAQAVGKSSFTPAERHVAWFAVNQANGCTYCMAAHTAIAKGEKIADSVITAARNGTPQTEPRLLALHEFTTAVVEHRGLVPTAALEEFRAAGFTNQNVLEVVTVVAMKTLSNYVNHIAKTPLDTAFQPFAWEPSAASR